MVFILFSKANIIIGKDYIRLKFMIPDIYCKLTVKVAVIYREEKIIRDCLIFEINVMNS